MSMPSPSFPPTGPPSDASLPSPWSGRVPCPRFRGPIEALRLPAALPAALRCLRLAVPRAAPCTSRPPPQDATLVGREFFGCGDPRASAAGSGGDGRTSHVLGRPPLPIRRVLRLRQDGTPLTVPVRQHGPR